MKDKQDIIRLFRTDGISELEIPPQTGFSRNTVRRYLGDTSKPWSWISLFYIPCYRLSGRVKTRVDACLIAENPILPASQYRKKPGRVRQTTDVQM